MPRQGLPPQSFRTFQVPRPRDALRPAGECVDAARVPGQRSVVEGDGLRGAAGPGQDPGVRDHQIDVGGIEPADAGETLERPVDMIVPADRKSTRLNSSHVEISYAVFCLKKKKNKY